MGVLQLAVVAAGPVVLFLLWMKDVIRPGSFQRRGRRDLWNWPWWLWLTCGFVVLFAQIAGAGMGMMVTGRGASDATNMVAVTVGGGVAALIVGLVLVRMVSRATPVEPERSGLEIRPRWRDLRAGLLGIAVAFPVVHGVGLIAGVLAALITGSKPSPIAHETLQTIHEHPRSGQALLLGAAAVIAAPIVEEIIFRVFLQSALLRATGRTWWAILITSALFALVHLGGGISPSQAQALAPLFILGMAMGIAYERTRRVAVPITMHAAFNIVNLLLLAVM